MAQTYKKKLFCESGNNLLVDATVFFCLNMFCKLQLQTMSESFFAGRETNDQAAANVLQTTSTCSDSQNHITGHRIVLPTCVPLAKAQPEDRNIDSLCSSPIVFSSTLRSFYNKENKVDSGSAEESYKGDDHCQVGLRTSKGEWVEQYQLGVFITLTVLPSGKKGLKRVRFRYIIQKSPS